MTPLRSRLLRRISCLPPQKGRHQELLSFGRRGRRNERLLSTPKVTHASGLSVSVPTGGASPPGSPFGSGCPRCPLSLGHSHRPSLRRRGGRAPGRTRGCVGRVRR